MESYKIVCTKEILSMLADRQWHAIYDIHEKYNIQPSSMIKVIDDLVGLGLVVTSQEASIKLSDSLDNRKLAIMNKYFRQKLSLHLGKGFTEI